MRCRLEIKRHRATEGYRRCRDGGVRQNFGFVCIMSSSFRHTTNVVGSGVNAAFACRMDNAADEESGLRLWGCCVATGSIYSPGAALRGGEAQRWVICPPLSEACTRRCCDPDCVNTPRGTRQAGAARPLGMPPVMYACQSQLQVRQACITPGRRKGSFSHLNFH